MSGARQRKRAYDAVQTHWLPLRRYKARYAIWLEGFRKFMGGLASREYILDAERNVIPCPSAEAWMEFNEGAEGWARKVVGETFVGNMRISTVFLGLDHNYRADGPPLVFETMVFRMDEGDPAEWQQRYATWDVAAAGHAECVEWAKEFTAEQEAKPAAP
jgi:hypothetical protein